MRRLLSLLILCPAGITRADDAAWTYVGGAGNFYQNGQIRMVSERVDVKLREKQSHFRAAFVFRNEGPATTVKMAFPEEKHSYGRPGGAIHRFFSTVDGTAVSVHRKRLPENPETGSEYRAVWLKTVRFAPHQTRRVVVDYWAENGDIGDIVQNKYILVTGATWKGTIGDAVINVDWSSFHGHSEPQFYFERGQRSDDGPARSAARKQTLRFHDFKPDFDVVMIWTSTFANFIINGEMSPTQGMEGRWDYIYGFDNDPKIAIRYIPNIFGTPAENDEETNNFPELGIEFHVGSLLVKVIGERTAIIDGKTVTLKRSGGIENRSKCVYLSDLIRAMGGTFHYNRKLDRDVIWVR